MSESMFIIKRLTWQPRIKMMKDTLAGAGNAGRSLVMVVHGNFDPLDFNGRLSLPGLVNVYIKRTGKIHHFQWVNPLFLWAIFNSRMFPDTTS